MASALKPWHGAGWRHLLTALLILAAAVPVPAAPRLEGIRAVAWTGGWGKDFRAPVLAAPAEGDVVGKLEDPLKVTWQRDGANLRVTVERLADAWCGLLGVQVTFAPGAAEFAYGMEDMPVVLPLVGASRGRELVATWHPGAPWWLNVCGDGGATGLAWTTDDGHGFTSALDAEGRLTITLRLMMPKVGERKTGLLQLRDGADVAAWRGAARAARHIAPDPPVDRAAADRLRAAGYVTVDAAGTGFRVGGQPWYAVGFNAQGGSLPCLPPAEQERWLAKMAGAGMTCLRLLTYDWLYRPLPGVLNQAGVERLRETVERAAAHGLRTTICLEYGGAAYQYHASRQVGVTVDDLFCHPAALRIYTDVVDGVVRPLRDDPAVLSWAVSNEPTGYLGPTPAGSAKADQWRQWLKEHGQPADTAVPTGEAWQAQQTPAAREFLRFDLARCAAGLIARARLVKAADPRHLVTISDGGGRLLRGASGAEVFDYWAPHTYDLWLNGPLIDAHVQFLAAHYRDGLPDRPRPVVIEEFGISEQPRFAEEMRAEHIRQYLAAGQRWGLAGVMHWFELTDRQFAAFAGGYTVPTPAPAPVLAAWLPASQYADLVFYHRYMARRGWENAVAAATAAGWRLRCVGDPREATDAAALLVLAKALDPADVAALAAAGRPVYLLPGAPPQPTATVLPADPAAQTQIWRGVRAGAARW